MVLRCDHPTRSFGGTRGGRDAGSRNGEPDLLVATGQRGTVGHRRTPSALSLACSRHGARIEHWRSNAHAQLHRSRTSPRVPAPGTRSNSHLASSRHTAVSLTPVPAADASQRRPLDAFFTPRTVAVIGATEAEGSVGATIFRNLIGGTFASKVFPVNPKRSTVFGVKAY